jgi:hypothetical protein
MAHELGITERGVAARISRLFAAFDVRNRAQLLAQTITTSFGTELAFEPATDATDDRGALPNLEREFSAYENAPFLVGVTLGPDHVMAYQNRLSRGLTVTPAIGKTHKEVYIGDASQAWWREKNDEAYTTGRPVIVSSAVSRFQRGDGSWEDDTFSCVAQPLRDQLSRVRGILWICVRDHGVAR